MKTTERNFRLPDTIAQNIQYFTGRTWLLPHLLKWLEQTEERMFILTGEPGTGKSMIIAWLTEAGPVSEDVDARKQLEQIRSLVKAVHFCVTSSGSVSPVNFAKNVANQLTKNVPGFGDALVKSLKDQVHISSEQQIGTMEAGSSATGVYIERLDLGELNEELSVDRVLRQPLQTLCANGYNQSILLLVDALDEAATYTGAIDLVRLLAKLSDLPQHIRFLLTTRPDPRVLKFYKTVKPFNLLTDAPEDVNDVRFYAYERLRELEHEQRNRLANRIAQAAQRIFLYAHLVINDLLARLPEIPDLDEVSLPKGLSGLYHDFLNRELGTDEDRWYSMFKPLLGLIAVAQGEGLTRTQIEHILSKDVEQPLRICKQYFTGNLPDGPFSPFHKSFADFLLVDKENIDYHIDPIQKHHQIVEYYQKKYRDCWEKLDNYGERHLLEHYNICLPCFQARPPDLSRVFDSLIAGRTRDFVGREFVLKALDAFLKDKEQESGYFIIKGEPGSGKSSLIAQLVKTRGYIHHFNIALQAINKPRQFLKSVCAQLIAQFELIHTTWLQAVKKDEEFWRRVGLWPETTKEDRAFLNQLLGEASEKLQENDRLVIAIDALDEADISELPSQANVLYLPSNLPPKVFFVVTTRPRHDIRLDVSNPRVLELQAGSNDNLQDARNYIKFHLQDKQMQERIASWNVTPEQFTDKILEESEGNFMYLHFVIPAIKASRFVEGGLDELPEGLIGYYKGHWRQMKSQDEETVETYYQPVVCVLAAIKEAISVEQIVAYTELEPNEIRKVIREWREFLYEEFNKEGERLYCFYHRSFQEFLQGEVDPGLKTYHKMIAG